MLSVRRNCAKAQQFSSPLRAHWNHQRQIPHNSDSSISTSTSITTSGLPIPNNHLHSFTSSLRCAPHELPRRIRHTSQSLTHPETSPTMSTSRAGFRFFARNLNSSSSHSQQPFQFKQFNNIFRRRQTTVAGVPGVEGAPAQQSFFQRIWTSEVGIKTVHFW